MELSTDNDDESLKQLADNTFGSSKHSTDNAFDAVAYINEPRWQKVSLGLSRMKRLLELLGNPEKSYRSIHVAGTNGKGSTCAYIASILECSGYKCGLFTSPYVIEFAERIRVNGAEIDDGSLHEITLVVKDAAESVERECGEHPTEFELMFALACVYFKRQECEVCVIEVGLGGRLDATNVIEPSLCVLTPISMDHTAILGDTIEQIASEKVGIIKPGVPVVVADQSNVVLSIIARKCKDEGCELYVAKSPEESSLASCVQKHAQLPSLIQKFSYKNKQYETRMLGVYQPENAALAIEAAYVLNMRSGFFIDDEAIHKGIYKATWPARFELAQVNPTVIIDGGHNPQGAQALVDSLGVFGAADHEIVFVMSVLADKDFESMLKIISPISDTLFSFTANSPRALDAQNLARAAISCGIEAYACKDASEAMARACFRAKEKGSEAIVCAFGSLYSVAAIKAALS